MGLSPCGYSYLATHLWKTSLYTEPGRGQKLFSVILISLRPKICTKTAWKKYYYYPENTKPYNRGTRKRFKCTFLREQHHQKFWTFFSVPWWISTDLLWGWDILFFEEFLKSPKQICRFHPRKLFKRLARFQKFWLGSFHRKVHYSNFHYHSFVHSVNTGQSRFKKIMTWASNIFFLVRLFVFFFV